MPDVRWTTVKLGGNSPLLELEVEDPDAAVPNSLVDWSTAGTVWLHAWNGSSVVVGSGTGTGGTSRLRYQFTQAQLGTASASIKAVFEVRWNGTKVDFQPRGGMIVFDIESLPA